MNFEKVTDGTQSLKNVQTFQTLKKHMISLHNHTFPFEIQVLTPKGYFLN